MPHPQALGRPSRITDREDDYKKRRLARKLSPARNDAFIMGDKTPDARVRTYADVMREQMLAREQANTLQNIADKQKAEAAGAAAAAAAAQPAAAPAGDAAAVGSKRRNRWDQSGADGCVAIAWRHSTHGSLRVAVLLCSDVTHPTALPPPTSPAHILTLTNKHHTRRILHLPPPLSTCSKRPKGEAGGSEWDAVEATPAAVHRWDATPGAGLGSAPAGANSWDATPGGASAAAAGSRWDATPGAGLGSATPGARRNRWDETPAAVRGAGWMQRAAALWRC